MNNEKTTTAFFRLPSGEVSAKEVSSVAHAKVSADHLGATAIGAGSWSGGIVWLYERTDAGWRGSFWYTK